MALPESSPGAAGVALPASLKHAVAHEVRRRIFAGELRPGARIDQDSIAGLLEVSKLPVREALISLEAEGIVDMVPRRGAFVATLSRDDIRDHYWILGTISGMAAERAATRLSEHTLAKLAEIADRMEAGEPNTEQERLNFEFHRLINHGAGSRRLRTQLKVLNGAIPFGFYPTDADWHGTSHEDHREILDALRARSADTARALTEKHFRLGGQRAVTLLEQLGFWPDNPA